MITKQCLVEIKIGGYKDEILCDLIPMDVCHILLGIPWHFDKNVIHDGRKNTFLKHKIMWKKKKKKEERTS